MADNQNPNKPQQINIQLSEQEAEGIYSNMAIISHSNAEFIIDFTRILPGIPKAKVHARIIMTPQHAKMLLMALGENIGKFESMNGEIKLEGPQNHNDNFPGFSNNPAIN